MSMPTNAEFEALRKRLSVPCWVEAGWQRIVVDAVRKVEWLLEKDPLVSVEWTEIKAWHGDLAMRYRLKDRGVGHLVSELITDVVTAAQRRADSTCVVCGSASVGELVEHGEQLRVLCATHRYQRDAHKLTVEQVVELLKPKVTAFAAAPIRKRSWRVVGTVPAAGSGAVEKIDCSIWVEDFPESNRDMVDVVEFGDQRERFLLRERDRARHHASVELVREAIDAEIERLELNYGIAEVREGERSGEWVVVVTDGATTNEQKWVESEDMPETLAVRTKSVRLVRVFG